MVLGARYYLANGRGPITMTVCSSTMQSDHEHTEHVQQTYLCLRHNQMNNKTIVNIFVIAILILIYYVILLLITVPFHLHVPLYYQTNYRLFIYEMLLMDFGARVINTHSHPRADAGGILQANFG